MRVRIKHEPTNCWPAYRGCQASRPEAGLLRVKDSDLDIPSLTASWDTIPLFNPEYC